jgi:hypothetical protein
MMRFGRLCDRALPRTLKNSFWPLSFSFPFSFSFPLSFPFAFRRTRLQKCGFLPVFRPYLVRAPARSPPPFPAPQLAKWPDFRPQIANR